MSGEHKERKRVLVTGGAGFIGSHTIVELLTNTAQGPYQVVCVDNFANSSPEAIKRVRELCKLKEDDDTLMLHKVDCCDYNALEEIFRKYKSFAVTIHFAGHKAVGESVDLPLMYYDNNLRSTINLLQLMEKYDSRNIIFSSSATVYGEPEKVPISEDAKVCALSPYGRTKLWIEEMLQDIAKGKTGPKWRIVILRYFNPVGAHKSGRIGEDPLGIPNNLMPYIAQVAVGKRPFLSVYGNDYATKDGTGVRDYIHVVDLARGHVAALEKGIYGDGMATNCEVFNLGRGAGSSVLEVVEAMRKASGKPIEYKIVARRPGDAASSFADPTKAFKCLGYKTQYTIDDVCEDTWRWQSNNPDGFNVKKQ